MSARQPHEANRAATPLELFFDLVFVVAIATAAADLHHGVAAAHALDAVRGYALAFFGIWWAWVNFTWFASAYDIDDVPYRLLVFVQMTGALIFASGVSQLAVGDLRVVVVGYAVMRVALVAQWLRAAANDADRRRTALRYAAGVFVVQLGWVGLLLLPEASVMTGILVLIVAELLVPVWAEAACPTSWHPHHIAERYGLLTIIVLGESVLAATASIGVALESQSLADLVPTIVGGLLILYSMWWLYFEEHSHPLLTTSRRAFVWGYAHYLVFAAAAAVGAGLSVVVDAATDHAAIDAQTAMWAVAIPAAIYILCLWALMDRGYGKSITQAPGPMMAVLVLLSPLAPGGVLTLGLVMAGYLAWKLMAGRGGMEGTTGTPEGAQSG